MPKDCVFVVNRCGRIFILLPVTRFNFNLFCSRLQFILIGAMNCEICSLDSTDDAVMWTCVGCTRTFHAACVGITVQRSSLRKKDKRIDPNSYIIPCCNSCQTLITLNFEIKALTEQQTKLAEIINSNTEIIHRSAQQVNPNAVHDAFEGMEILLTSIKNELSTINKNSSLVGSVSTIKNHITTMFDIAMKAAKENMEATMKSMSAVLSTDLRNINNDINQLNQLSIDTAASFTMNSNPMLGLDILDELKSSAENIISNQHAATESITSAISSLDSRLSDVHISSEPPSDPSSNSEPLINIENLKPPSDPNTNSEAVNHNSTLTCRMLGSKKVWRADWTEYDLREYRRTQQIKARDKAIKRKKQLKKQRNRYNIQNNRRVEKCHEVKSNNNIYPFPRNSTERNVFINQGDIYDKRNHTASLPLDRELLAAAKLQFSGPPLSTNGSYGPHGPYINFQRGEVLNPYPTDERPTYLNRTSATERRRSCQCFCRN